MVVVSTRRNRNRSRPTPPTTATQALAASRMSRQWKCRDCPVTSAVPSATALAAAQVTCQRVTPPLLSAPSAPLPVTSTALWFANLIPTVVAKLHFRCLFQRAWTRETEKLAHRLVFPCSLTVGMLLHVAIHASWNLWILAKIKYGLGAGGWQFAIRMYPWSWNKSWISTSHQEPDLARRSWVLAFAPMTQVRSWQSKRPWPRPDKHAFLEDYQCWQWLWWETEVLFRCQLVLFEVTMVGH